MFIPGLGDAGLLALGVGSRAFKVTVFAGSGSRGLMRAKAGVSSMAMEATARREGELAVTAQPRVRAGE